MAVTGKLGTSDSLLGNLLLGDLVIDTLTTSDSPTLSESISRTLVLQRTVTDAPTTSESISRIGGFSRTTVDATTISESATAASVLGNAVFDAPHLTDDVVVVTLQPRDASETPTVSESLIGIVTAPRTTSETPTVSESVDWVGNYLRGPTESPTLSESVDRVLVLSRTATDTPTISETISQISGKLRDITDAPTTSESVDRTGTFNRTDSDAPTLSESIDWVANLNRTDTDAPTLSDSAGILKSANKTGTDVPTLSDNVIAVKGFGVVGTDAPTISEDATSNKILFKSLSNSLTLTQSATASQPVQSIEQNFVISQTVEHAGEYSKSLSNTLTGLLQVADYFKFKPIEVSNTLTITQTVDEVQTTGLVSSLTITQDATYQYANHLDQEYGILVPTQTVAVAAIFNRTITQPVTLVQTVVPLKIITQSVTSTLGIYQTALGGPLRNAHNELVLDQVVVHEAIRSPVVATQALHVTQSVGLQMILNRGLVSTLAFKNEHPIADGAGSFIQVPNLILTKGGSALNNECCPISRVSTLFQSSTRAIVLPNPELNDGEGLVAAVSIKRTITGMTYSYVKKSANRKLKYKFLINQRKAYELRQFLLDFLGNRITHTNWKGEMWSGFILTDPAEITSNARGGVCTGDLYEIDLEYQGVRVN